MSVEAPADVVIHDNVQIGEGVKFGSFVVVHSGTVIGDNCVIEDGVVLGKTPKLAGRSGSSDVSGLMIDEGVTICSGAIVFAGSHICSDVIIGDQSYVRERVVIGERTVIGRGSTVDNDVRIGKRVSVQTSVYLTAYSLVEDNVFIAPCVTTTNDNTMGRHGEDYQLQGATFRRGCRVGGGAVLTPGVEIGEEAFVAAGAVVVDDVAAKTVVMGVPAREVRQVPERDLLENWSKS